LEELPGKEKGTAEGSVWQGATKGLNTQIRQGSETLLEDARLE